MTDLNFILTNGPSQPNIIRKRISFNNIAENNDVNLVDNFEKKNHNEFDPNKSNNKSKNVRKNKKLKSIYENEKKNTKIIINELLVHFSNSNNSKQFKIYELSKQLNLKHSKLEGINEVFEILKITQLVNFPYYQWNGIKENKEFEQLLSNIYNSDYDFCTGKIEKKVKSINQINNYIDYRIKRNVFQIIKLFLKTGKCPIAFDTILFSLYPELPNDKKTFTNLQSSKNSKSSQFILKVLESINLISVLDSTKNGIAVYNYNGTFALND